VVGFFQSGMQELDKTQSYASIATVQKLKEKPNNYITDIQIKLKDLSTAPQIAKEYARLFEIENQLQDLSSKGTSTATINVTNEYKKVDARLSDIQRRVDQISKVSITNASAATSPSNPIQQAAIDKIQSRLTKIEDHLRSLLHGDGGGSAAGSAASESWLSQRLDRLERKLEYSSRRDISANSGSNSPGRGTNRPASPASPALVRPQTAGALGSTGGSSNWQDRLYPKKLLNSQSTDALDDPGPEPYIPQSLSHTGVKFGRANRFPSRKEEVRIVLTSSSVRVVLLQCLIAIVIGWRNKSKDIQKHAFYFTKVSSFSF
jgi:tetrahydromethanopterin S-methyltransferase subunit G